MGGWGTAGQLLGKASGPSGPFLNRPFHTTPTPSTPRNKEAEEPAKEGECTAQHTRWTQADGVFTDSVRSVV